MINHISIDIIAKVNHIYLCNLYMVNHILDMI